MREQEANILLLFKNSIKYNMLSFHSGDVGQFARPREREKSNIRTLGRVHKVKSHSLGHECLIKIIIIIIICISVFIYLFIYFFFWGGG